ncbi:hypothetical protein Harman_42040 [Haloarcula mannanilytica]|uniref:Uncharacterized protein n=1 Tax=Haloarcula mannanilytica TaxID=2509225 RepID=A0A4C2EVM5_9EURY|nr:hypothetical protein [Haloarcula mannanilytica]GCF16269.1 hypothetical protein Harman_42040 [Haloarcula mannanilytica]
MNDADQDTDYLKFGYPNVGYVIDGLEDSTIRVGLERDFEVGQRIELRTPKNTVFGHGTVQDIYTSRVEVAHHDVVVVDGREHPSESKHDLPTSLRDHYPDAEVRYDTEVTVVYFDAETGLEKLGSIESPYGVGIRRSRTV